MARLPAARAKRSRETRRTASELMRTIKSMARFAAQAVRCRAVRTGSGCSGIRRRRRRGCSVRPRLRLAHSRFLRHTLRTFQCPSRAPPLPPAWSWTRLTQLAILKCISDFQFEPLSRYTQQDIASDISIYDGSGSREKRCLVWSDACQMPSLRTAIRDIDLKR